MAEAAKGINHEITTEVTQEVKESTAEVTQEVKRLLPSCAKSCMDWKPYGSGPAFSSSRPQRIRGQVSQHQRPDRPGRSSSGLPLCPSFRELLLSAVR